MTPEEALALLEPMLDQPWFRKRGALDAIATLQACVEALEQIAKGAGPYSRDKLTHAENTIRAMVEYAEAALRGEV